MAFKLANGVVVPFPSQSITRTTDATAYPKFIEAAGPPGPPRIASDATPKVATGNGLPGVSDEYSRGDHVHPGGGGGGGGGALPFLLVDMGGADTVLSAEAVNGIGAIVVVSQSGHPSAPLTLTFAADPAIGTSLLIKNECGADGTWDGSIKIVAPSGNPSGDPLSAGGTALVISATFENNTMVGVMLVFDSATASASFLVGQAVNAATGAGQTMLSVSDGQGGFRWQPTTPTAAIPALMFGCTELSHISSPSYLPLGPALVPARANEITQWAQSGSVARRITSFAFEIDDGNGSLGEDCLVEVQSPPGTTLSNFTIGAGFSGNGGTLSVVTDLPPLSLISVKLTPQVALETVSKSVTIMLY